MDFEKRSWLKKIDTEPWLGVVYTTADTELAQGKAPSTRNPFKEGRCLFRRGTRPRRDVVYTTLPRHEAHGRQGVIYTIADIEPIQGGMTSRLSPTWSIVGCHLHLYRNIDHPRWGWCVAELTQVEAGSLLHLTTWSPSKPGQRLHCP